MITFKKIAAAAVLSVAALAPLAGVAQAKPALNGFAGKTLETRSDFMNVAYRGRIATPRVDRRINNQKRRIRRGVRNGRLTRTETFRLRSRLFAIRTARRFAKIDGRVTRSERRRLNALLNKNSNRIRRLSRNGRRQF